MALPKTERLKNRRILRSMTTLPKIFSGKYFILLGSKSPSPLKNQLPKVAFVISKKKQKLSPLRNKAKRRISEAYRLYRSKLPQDCTSLYNSLIFIINNHSITDPFQDIEKSVQIACSSIFLSEENELNSKN